MVFILFVLLFVAGCGWLDHRVEALGKEEV
jgi:hypothetical protein